METGTCPWADELDCAVTVCDTQGVVVYQNARSRAVNGDVRGRSMLPCHSERSRAIIARLLETGGKNVYTIEKRGRSAAWWSSRWRFPRPCPTTSETEKRQDRCYISTATTWKGRIPK